MTEPYDLAILNARIIDGTGGPEWIGDVGVRGDRIEVVGHVTQAARRTIDAFGRILTPGFIDIHGHSDYSMLADPLARSKIYQGVTTEVNGNCGYHAAPCFGQVSSERRAEYRASLQLDIDWQRLDDYLNRLEQAQPAINYVYQIGYNTLASAVSGDHSGPLSVSERERIKALVREGFAAGAAGLSYGIAYVPACFTSAEELVDAAEITGECGGILSFHIRDEGDRLLESLEEALEISERGRARTHIGHLKTFRRGNWHKIDRALGLLEEARGRGLDLSVDRYPHVAMNTQLKYALPKWALEGGVEAMKRRLRDPDARARLCEEMTRTSHDEVAEVLIALVSRPSNKRVEGLFLDQLCQDGQEPWAVVCDLLAEEGDAAFATFFGMTQDNLDRILSLDYAIVASDSSIQAVDRQAGGGRPHPRCFDTFPYFLAEWVLNRSVLSFPQAIRRITSYPANRWGLQNRGLIAEGYYADLVLVEPSALEAQVSYEEPIRYPPGIRTVVVNGAIAVDDGRHTGRRHGRSLRSHRA